ncbi:hypothetical protein CCMA1212_004185 [Trichoderma ghanense]|uniref:Uncharacterized protein n=1 Tax=Trichoderma ghanense TaxID=65468 RepID=A0ABY2H7X5_9HYPO
MHRCDSQRRDSFPVLGSDSRLGLVNGIGSGTPRPRRVRENSEIKLSRTLEAVFEAILLIAALRAPSSDASLLCAFFPLSVQHLGLSSCSTESAGLAYSVNELVTSPNCWRL